MALKSLTSNWGLDRSLCLSGLNNIDWMRVHVSRSKIK